MRFLRPLILLPLVLPPVVGGIALLYAFGRLGLLGHYLEAAGISIAFSTTAVVLAQTFVSLPFLVISLEGAARTAGADYEVVAATLGARPSTVWWRVTLPLLLPGLVSGAVLAFARSLGEFGATLTFAGSREGVTRTLPLEIYLQRVSDPNAAVALSILLVAVAALVVLVLGVRGADRDRRRGSRHESSCSFARSWQTAVWMWNFRCRRARCSRCWGPTARASRPRCTSSPDCFAPTRVWCGWGTGC